MKPILRVANGKCMNDFMTSGGSVALIFAHESRLVNGSLLDSAIFKIIKYQILHFSYTDALL